MGIRVVFSNGTNVPMSWNVSNSGHLLASGTVSGVSSANVTVSGTPPYRATLWPRYPSGVLQTPRFDGNTEITFAITTSQLE